MEVSKEQMMALLDQGLFSSAQTLGCFLVSSSVNNAEANSHVKAENLVLLGDALFREKEYLRAIVKHVQARYATLQDYTQTSRSLSTSTRSSSPNSYNVSAINEYEVKYKIASCHSALSESKAALAEMEGIPCKARNLQMNLLMGKLYRNSRHSRAATSCYKECLRHCPYIFEAIIALAEMGATAKDIIALFPQMPNRSNRSPFEHTDTSRWLHVSKSLKDE